ncbi:hypothetical protein [Rubellimicrobium arenae]|uniref:hypothetical protein n=1 Tax=Rubellimicrobium arenae TaxID=2817372 RepID=UPI001B313C9F|nr:hypothetical protein [Rubellimicrobium arenae]
MAIKVEHELHMRRWGRNLGLGLILAALVAIVFGLTIVKILALGDPDKFQGYDHVVQPMMDDQAGEGGQ